MISLNLHRIMLQKGITRSYTYLRHLGITHFVATKYIAGSYKSMKFKDIEKMCIAMHCTPNDLLEWRKTENDIDLPLTHPLKVLHHTETTTNINQLLINANPETLKEVQKLLLGQNQ